MTLSLTPTLTLTEYLKMHRRMVLSLQPTVTPAEAAEARAARGGEAPEPELI